MSADREHRDGDTGEFRDGLARGELVLHLCRDCGAYSEPRVRICPVCRSLALDPVAAAGEGRVVSSTVAHGRPREDGSTALGTYVVVALLEGPWWWGELLEPAGPVRAGDAVRVEIGPGADGETLAAFRLV